MPFEYVDLKDARERSGLRMIVVPGVPSPWGEAAKGIFHVKRLPFVAVRLNQSSDEMAEWAGGARSGPVAFYDDEPPRSGWAEILLLAERLAPEPALLPADPAERALAFGLSHEICGEMGLGWCGRNAGVHGALHGHGDFPGPVAQYLGSKYGYREAEGERYRDRVIDLLGMLAGRLQAQQQAGSRYYLGDTLSVVDIYSAAFMALLKPLPPDQCPMIEAMRPAFENQDEAVARALDPILIKHRDRIYAEHLELPLSL